MSPSLPEVWLRGPIHGFDPSVMPAVHALLQVREDLRHLVATVPAAHVWARPGRVGVDRLPSSPYRRRARSPADVRARGVSDG